MFISWVRRFRGVGLLLEEPMLAREEVRDMVLFGSLVVVVVLVLD